MEKVQVHHDGVYIAKVKGLYFLMVRFQDIMQLRQGRVSHEELASIFKIEDRLNKESPRKGG